MTRSTTLIAFVATVLLAAAAGAQEHCPSCVDSVAGKWHMLPALGLRAGIPQKVSAAVGIVAGRNYRENGHIQDVAIYLEPGLSAGRATIGYLSGFGNMGSGWGIGGTAMRTWRDPINLKTNATFIGGEVWVWPGFFIGPRVGLFRQMTGARNGWFFTADFGVGL